MKWSALAAAELGRLGGAKRRLLNLVCIGPESDQYSIGTDSMNHIPHPPSATAASQGEPEAIAERSPQ
ncbi:hypothetical protein [Nocardia sp. NPDC050718]|uniref:hypothetical protein n=1 Tax=Nocardia sp. NPDC050718 TaxID=3155788 RepID=UPI0033D63A14